MLMIRLQRIGRKNDPSFRIIVTDKRESTTSTRFADIVGTYQPKAGTIEIDAEKVTKWLKNGAQASPTVHNMLVTKKIIEGKKINVLPKNKIVNRLKAEAEKKAAEDAKNAPAPVVAAPVVEEVKAEEVPAPAVEEVPAVAEPTPVAEPEAPVEEVVPVAEPEAPAEAVPAEKVAA